MKCKCCGQEMKAPKIKDIIVKPGRYYKQVCLEDETAPLLYFKAGEVFDYWGGIRMEKGIMFYANHIKINFMTCNCDDLIIRKDYMDLVKRITKKEFNQAIRQVALNHKEHIKMALAGKRYRI